MTICNVFSLFVCSAEALRKLRASFVCGSRSKGPCSTLNHKVAIFELELWKCTLRALRLHYKAAIFELELRKCTSHTTLPSCERGYIHKKGCVALFLSLKEIGALQAVAGFGLASGHRPSMLRSHYLPIYTSLCAV